MFVSVISCCKCAYPFQDLMSVPHGFGSLVTACGWCLARGCFVVLAVYDVGALVVGGCWIFWMLIRCCGYGLILAAKTAMCSACLAVVLFISAREATLQI